MSMNKTKADGIVARLLANAAGLRYGTVTVKVKLHDGRVTSVDYFTTTNVREYEPKTETETT
jgi:hypothetical protein